MANGRFIEPDELGNERQSSQIKEIRPSDYLEYIDILSYTRIH